MNLRATQGFCPGIVKTHQESSEVSEWFTLLLPMRFHHICPIVECHPPSNVGQLGNSQYEGLGKGRGAGGKMPI